eukprot:IDg7t1
MDVHEVDSRGRVTKVSLASCATSDGSGRDLLFVDKVRWLTIVEIGLLILLREGCATAYTSVRYLDEWLRLTSSNVCSKMHARSQESRSFDFQQCEQIFELHDSLQ